MMHITENHEALLDYLYEEGTRPSGSKSRSISAVRACSVAVLELQSVRGLLAEWTPPAVPLGFKVVQADEPAPVQMPVHVPFRKVPGAFSGRRLWRQWRCSRPAWPPRSCACNSRTAR
jgi:hypothetical protein